MFEEAQNTFPAKSKLYILDMCKNSPPRYTILKKLRPTGQKWPFFQGKPIQATAAGHEVDLSVVPDSPYLLRHTWLTVLLSRDYLVEHVVLAAGKFWCHRLLNPSIGVGMYFLPSCFHDYVKLFLDYVIFFCYRREVYQRFLPWLEVI